jgi:hypothetical protein
VGFSKNSDLENASNSSQLEDLGKINDSSQQEPKRKGEHEKDEQEDDEESLDFNSIDSEGMLRDNIYSSKSSGGSLNDDTFGLKF